MSEKLEKKLGKELANAAEQINKFEESVKNLTHDRMNQAPKEEVEPQTKLSSREIANSKDIYLKPERQIEDKVPFNEKFRKNWEFDKEYVQFIAEHREILGEDIETWTKPYAGVPAQFWRVPTNKPVWGPRHLAEQIKRCKYHRLRTDEARITGNAAAGQFYGGMVVDTTVNRLDAMPVSDRKSIFMGASNF